MRLPKRRKVPAFVSIPLPVVAVVAGGVGFGLGAASEHSTLAQETPPPPGVSPSDLHKYSHNGSQCLGHEHVDPVNVLYIRDGFPSWINDHSEHHGWRRTDGVLTEHQYYADMFHCQQDHDQRASQAAYLPHDERFHQRYYMHLHEDDPGDNDSPRVHPDYGGFASATAHHEDLIGPPTCHPILPKHAVDGNEESFSISGIGTVNGGYNYAREEIRNNWVILGVTIPTPIPPPPPGGGMGTGSFHQHDLLFVRDWDNVDPRPQCDADPVAGTGIAKSDGKVYYIGVKA